MMHRLCEALPKKEEEKVCMAHPLNIPWERAEQHVGMCGELPYQRKIRNHLGALLCSGVKAGAAGSFQVWSSCLPLLLQHCSWRCISSSGRWPQLWWWHWLWLFRLLALAGAVGKMNVQGLAAPSSITICQTFIYKVPKQKECWCHWQQSLGPT